ncbi:hypothetical protein DDI_3731 [Dickeya dianthicola RNS04.9]|nr:hypothetical protein DDI_3731 [Dickeya dianthicola RNS04.9]
MVPARRVAGVMRHLAGLQRSKTVGLVGTATGCGRAGCHGHGLYAERSHTRRVQTPYRIAKIFIT